MFDSRGELIKVDGHLVESTSAIPPCDEENPKQSAIAVMEVAGGELWLCGWGRYYYPNGPEFWAWEPICPISNWEDTLSKIKEWFD